MAVTRAREKVVLVTSMPINDISDWLATGQATKPRDYLQAYIDYVHLVNPAAPAITIHFRVNDAGNGATPGGGPQVGLDHFVTWKHNGGGVPQPLPAFFNLGNELLQINRWYRIHTGIYLENGQSFFPASCANNDVDIRIQVLPHSLRPVLQLHKAGRTVETALRPARE